VKIALASDHAGFDYKQQIADHLRNDGYGVVDFGCHSSESCDYPDFVHPAAAAVAAGECDRGIVFGGSGNGEAITANRHAGIRCALCWNEETARLSRLHNDANMISLGQRMLDQSTAIKAVDIWLSTEFEGGRHIARIRGIDKLPPC
jgi:ribose 5-phosphate isomerase B